MCEIVGELEIVAPARLAPRLYPASSAALLDSRWASFPRMSHAIPRPYVAPHIRIVGIATFVDTVESSLNRIACETVLSERTRAHVGLLIRAWAL